jgi:hypothetical protein
VSAETLELQQLLSLTGHDPGDHDGALGPMTLGAAVDVAHSQGWSDYADALAGGTVPPGFVADLQHMVALITAQSGPPSDRGIVSVGAWAWRRDLLRNHEKMVQRAHTIGLTDVDLFVTRVTPSRFAALAADYQAAGIEVHATFWAYPDHMARAREYVDTGAPASITLDTEHVLTRAYRKDPGCVDVIAAGLRGITVPVAVTGYGYATKADKALCRALAAVGVEVIALPQGYSVPYITRGGERIDMPPAYQPRVAQRNAHRSWKGLAAANVMGLACYKRPPNGWIGQCAEEAGKLGYGAVRYWDIGSMRGRVGDEVAAVCAAAAERRAAL